MTTSVNCIHNLKSVLVLGMILCFSLTAVAGPPILIDKNTTDAELKALVAQEKEKGNVLEFSKVQRNADGEINKINIEYKSVGTEIEQSVHNTDGIDPITIGNSGKMMMFYGQSKGGKDKNLSRIYVEKFRDGNEDMGLSEDLSEHMSIHRENMAKHREEMKKHQENIAKLKQYIAETMESRKETENFDFDAFDFDMSNLIADLEMDEIDDIIESVFDPVDRDFVIWTPESKAEPYILIDGIESDEDTMKNLDPNQIAKIEVLKGEEASTAYGDNGANGVVIVTTKKD